MIEKNKSICEQPLVNPACTYLRDERVCLLNTQCPMKRRKERRYAMKLMKPSFEILQITENPLELIEKAGRTCYKSEDKITPESATKFVKNITKIGHHSVIEHAVVTVVIVCDRGVTHEIVRHRLASYSQESTRYVNYAKSDEITVIDPFFFDPYEPCLSINVPFMWVNHGQKSITHSVKYSMNSFDVWMLTCLWAEWGYLTLVNQFGRKPQEARSVLPNSTKTEIVITCNVREWLHIFNLRTKPAAHPQMVEIMKPLLSEFQRRIPEIFDYVK